MDTGASDVETPRDPDTIPARGVAAFDFDGTLTRHDSLRPFLERAVGRGPLVRAAAADATQIAMIAAGRGDRDATKARLLARLLAGRPGEPLAELGRRYAEHLADTQLRPETLARLRWHQAAGHEVLIVSASLEVYLAEVGRLLGLDAVLCTGLEVDDAGLLTGSMTGGNCRGPEKARRLRRHLGPGPVELWAYGDSAGDDEMLAMADHPVRLRRRVGRVELVAPSPS